MLVGSSPIALELGCAQRGDRDRQVGMHGVLSRLGQDGTPLLCTGARQRLCNETQGLDKASVSAGLRYRRLRRRQQRRIAVALAGSVRSDFVKSPGSELADPLPAADIALPRCKHFPVLRRGG